MTRWTLTFRAEGDGPPVELRVRRLLKAALRCHGLRCVDARAATVPRRTPQGAPDGPGGPKPVPRRRTPWRGIGTRATGLPREDRP